MGGHAHIWIVIAAYNEERSITKVAHDLQTHGYQNIIIVDDGSKDQTTSVAMATGAHVLRHIINRGQGAALQTGISYARTKGADIIITFDADGQHHAKDLKRLTKPIIQGKADIVLSSRFKGHNNAPFLRKLLLQAGAFSFRILYGVKLTDSHNGLRALSSLAAEKIQIKSDGMEHASEIIEQVAEHHLRYVEVPNTITYSKDTLEKGQSNSAAIDILSKMLLGKLKR